MLKKFDDLLQWDLDQELIGILLNRKLGAFDVQIVEKSFSWVKVFLFQFNIVTPRKDQSCL